MFWNFWIFCKCHDLDLPYFMQKYFRITRSNPKQCRNIIFLENWEYRNLICSETCVPIFEDGIREVWNVGILKIWNFETLNVSNFEVVGFQSTYNKKSNNSFINRLLMVNGSWLKAGACPSAKFFLAMSLEPRPLRHEPLSLGPWAMNH